MLLLTSGIPDRREEKENGNGNEHGGGSNGCVNIDLPEWILVSEIFCRLHRLKDVATARCVCKRWNRLLSSPEFGNVWHGKPIWMCGGELWFTHTYAHHKWEAVRFSSLFLSFPFSPSPLPCLGSGSGSRSISASSSGFMSISARSACSWHTYCHRVEIASSHGLLFWARMDAVFTKVRDLVVQNPASRKSKRIPWPSSSCCSNKTIPMENPVDRLFYGRFIEHDLDLQRYKIFLCCAGFHPTQKSAFLFDSASMAWCEIVRKRMKPRRLCRSEGFRFHGDDNKFSSSVIIIKYSVDPAAEDPEKQVTIVAYDSRSKTWDEVHLRLRNRITTNFSSRRRRSYLDSTSVSADGKHQVCRVIAIDEEGKKEEEEEEEETRLWDTKVIISLWQLVVVEDDNDEEEEGDGVGFDLVSWTTCTRSSMGFWGAEEMWARIIRSDEEAFVAVVVLHDNDDGKNHTNKWDMLVIGYDVLTSSWNVTTPPPHHIMLQLKLKQLHHHHTNNNNNDNDGEIHHEPLILHHHSPSFFLYPSLWSFP